MEEVIFSRAVQKDLSSASFNIEYSMEGVKRNGTGTFTDLSTGYDSSVVSPVQGQRWQPELGIVAAGAVKVNATEMQMV